ncbi:hypothetical protein CLOSTASPAR_05634 [[Clostridium] asparagiforme DSM 15981]|uniref:Uncharacterized protein n=1 Tax=[Clostridium] asparagiforme DSM 15981 TaxID=518636 RepID=C0D8N6_9FIRM|nr:hypothetical protein CLOSTASPAR_05634 [[Clostridium] asparagiforme DSM 15981]
MHAGKRRLSVNLQLRKLTVRCILRTDNIVYTDMTWIYEL